MALWSLRRGSAAAVWRWSGYRKGTIGHRGTSINSTHLSKNAEDKSVLNSDDRIMSVRLHLRS